MRSLRSGEEHEREGDVLVVYEEIAEFELVSAVDANDGGSILG